jgi:sulfotransferase family protein
MDNPSSIPMREVLDTRAVATHAVPEFVIIGAAKSASTWLHLALRQHPDVYMPVSETPFFEDPYYNERDLSPLAAELKPAPGGAVVGIKCPNYLCTAECAPRLAKHLPNARLIAILRNPVDRAISQYYHLIRSGRIPVAPADDAFARYLAGQFDPPYAKQQVMDFGLYAQGIANYRRVFPRERLLILTDLDLRGGSLDVFKRVCRFLEIEDSSVPRGISMRRNQGVYFSPALSFIQSLNHRGTVYDPSTGLVAPRPGLIGWSVRRLALLASRLSAATRIFLREQEPAVSFETRTALLEFYLPDIVKLEAMTKLDLSSWKVLRRN